VEVINHQCQSKNNQRDWYWHGWRIRYTFQRVKAENRHQDVPIILLHGFGASVRHWRKNIPVLSEYHTVYALDLLGFGASTKAYTNYDVELWAELVSDFWSTFIRQPVILIGNSIGSLIALVATIKHPQMSCGLAMLSVVDLSAREKMIPQAIQPLLRGLESLVASPWLIRIIFNFVKQPSVIRRWLKLAYVDETAIDDELVEIIATPPQDKGAARTLIALSKSVNRSDFACSTTELLQQVNIPMLLIWGKSDRFIPPTLAPQLAQANPLIELKLLDNVGHCPHDECPELLNNLLLEWTHQFRSA
jgi:haloalkane dehalogenase